MKLKKSPKRVKSKPKVLDPQAILSESESWRRMLTDMQNNLGYIPDTPDAKRAVAIEAKLEINSHVNGYAHLAAVSILNGLPEPEVKRSPGFAQGLMHFLLAELQVIRRKGENTYVQSVKNLLRWSVGAAVDPAVAIVVTQTAFTLCDETMREAVNASDEYRVYIEEYQLFLDHIRPMK